MASDVKSVNKTKFDLGGSGDNYLPSGQYGNEPKTMNDSYLSTAIILASTISFCNLPQGAIIKGIRIIHEAMGSGVTCTVGDSTSAARYYATGTSIAAVGQLDSILFAGLDYVIGTADDDDVIVITTEAATMDADKGLKVIVTYV